MRNLLPIAVVLLAAGVLFAGLGQSLANTEIPDQVPVAATAATTSTANNLAPGAWVETAAKPTKPEKSPKTKPTEPFPPGRRPR